MSEDDLQCQICFRPYRSVTPLILACGHSFCQDCLQAALKKEPICPTCKCVEARVHGEIPINYLLQDLSEWAVSLQADKDYLLSSIDLPFDELTLRGGNLHIEIRVSFLYLKCQVPFPSDRRSTVLESGEGWSRISHEFRNGKTLGVLVATTGFAFAGQLEALHGVGFGLKLWPSGATYFGYLKEFQSHGIGRMTYPNNVTEEGLWRVSQLHGLGLRVWNQNSYYRGQFQKHEPNGYGYMRYPDGSSYIGFWKQGIRAGKGVLTTEEGDVTSGLFEGNQVHDLATTRHKDGRVTKGKFKNGVREGVFLTTDQSGKEVKEIFIAGKLIE